MNNRNFNTWLSTFRSSIANYTYYTDFPKIYQNVDAIKLELHLLNSLIGSSTIESDFYQLATKYPEVIKCIPILLAIRTKEIYCLDEQGGILYQFTDKKQIENNRLPLSQYAYFMRETGLFSLLQNHIVHNLVDYVTGIETGLDSNARKNRGGHLMENLVEKYILEAGFIKNKNYFKEMYIHQIREKWNVNLSSISNQGKTEKRFDFVIKTASMVYGIETNFYASSGSKLNETARSYKTLALESKIIDGFSFVWFTDGHGWMNARHNLEEIFDVLPHLYNIHDLEENIIRKVLI